ncbi:hypothetical protein [Cohnella nanjingensis]|nr:hypothetical protein [Cohnella nanjingensis]
MNRSQAQFGRIRIVAVIPPLLIFFFAQKYFIQGIVISGSKG